MNSLGLGGYFNTREISNKQTVLIGLDLSKEKRPYWFNTVVYAEIAAATQRTKRILTAHCLEEFK